MTIEQFIQNYLCIDPTSPTGLTWLGHRSKSHAAQRIGKPAGTLYDKGYYMVKISGKRHPNHRIVYFLHHRAWPASQVDHIDGNPLNNSPDNLRDVTASENNHNKLGRGYSWSKTTQKWQARIKLHDKSIHLGCFTTEDEARAAYLAAKAQLHPTAPQRCYM